MASSSFSAADAALGYLFQVRVALLWSLRRVRSGGDFIVSLETLDDVTFEARGGTPEDLLQTKHHRNREASLSDASPDLWKSLRVWFERRALGAIPTTTTLHLLTTGTARDGSAASHLRMAAGRDIERALTLLTEVAQSSESKENAPAYAAFLRANAAVRRVVLESVVVLDRAPDILTIDDDLTAEVFWSAEQRYLAAFLGRLEGWWFRRVIKQLASNEKSPGVLSAEIEAEMSELREQFKQDSLPIDDDLATIQLDDVTQDAHADYRYVHQLRIIEAGKRRITLAVRDFYRAFEQRSRWLRDDLLLVGDLTRYEAKLVEEWELVFEAAKDELEATAVEAAKCKAARAVLTWAEQTTIAIRPGVTEPFVVRGSFHILADAARVGWHPDFRDRLAALLGTLSAGVPSNAAGGEPK